MQPLDHLLSSKPFHPHMKKKFISSKAQIETLTRLRLTFHASLSHIRLDYSLVYFRPHIFAF